jgi:hypothetical protein
MNISLFNWFKGKCPQPPNVNKVQEEPMVTEVTVVLTGELVESELLV